LSEHHQFALERDIAGRWRVEFAGKAVPAPDSRSDQAQQTLAT
jgi:hypothetical protein